MFKKMWSHTILEVSYVLLSLTSFLALFTTHVPFVAAVGGFIIYNLVLRLIFESIILKFDMHKRLASIEEMLSEEMER